jgi:hypothetical protein
MHKLLSSIFLSALLVPAALFADSFEGTVTMKMSGREAAGKSAGGGAEMTFSLKDGRTRADMAAQGQSIGVIMDPAKQEMTMLMTQQQMYMVRPISAPATAGATGEKAGGATLEKTATTEKILGYECTKYVVQDKNRTTELWLTEELGSFMNFSGGGPMGRGGPAPQGWEALLQGKNFFPMRVVSTEGGKEVGRLEVTAVEKKSLPDTLFAVPAGWRDIGAMMGGRGMPGRP